MQSLTYTITQMNTKIHDHELYVYMHEISQIEVGVPHTHAIPLWSGFYHVIVRLGVGWG